jgi:hypothetical protein
MDAGVVILLPDPEKRGLQRCGVVVFQKTHVEAGCKRDIVRIASGCCGFLSHLGSGILKLSRSMPMFGQL